MVQRLAKGVLPANTQIQKDALLAISKSATVFVNYLATHANDNAVRANKKTIQPKDIYDSIHDLDFDEFLPRLQAELESTFALPPVSLPVKRWTAWARLYTHTETEAGKLSSPGEVQG